MAEKTYEELSAENEALKELLAVIAEGEVPFPEDPDDMPKMAYAEGRRLDQITVYADVRAFADASYIRDSATILRESWAKPLGYEPKAEAA